MLYRGEKNQFDVALGGDEYITVTADNYTIVYDTKILHFYMSDYPGTPVASFRRWKYVRMT